MDDKKEAFGPGKNRSVRVYEFGPVIEFAAVAADVCAYKSERGMERRGPQIVDFHVARHGNRSERKVEFAHRLVQKRSDDATMDIAGWPLVQAGEVHD